MAGSRYVHHALIAATWPQFMAVLVIGWASINAVFAIESTVGILAPPIVTDGVPSFVFRMANLRRNQIVEARARVVMARYSRFHAIEADAAGAHEATR
jgi:hypothetical protein